MSECTQGAGGKCLGTLDAGGAGDNIWAPGAKLSNRAATGWSGFGSGRIGPSTTAYLRARLCFGVRVLRELRLRVDVEFAHAGLEGGPLHAEFGGRSVGASDFAVGVAEGAVDGVALGGGQGLDFPRGGPTAF
jgi:hypothetical protein